MTRFYAKIEAAGAILLALIWISPLVYAFWAAFHSTSDAVNFNLFSPLIFFDSLSTAVLRPAKDRLQPALLIIGSGSLKKFLSPNFENFSTFGPPG